jgi:adenylate kinase family enzyme
VTQSKYKRISIIGSPGAGKTILSNELVKITGLPAYHLDKYYLEKPNYWDEHNLEWIDFVKNLIKKDEWIIDGNYSKTFDERFNRSDLIVLLDVSRADAFKGIISRRIRYHKKKRPEMPDGWKEKLNKDFLKFVWKYHNKNKHEIKEKISKIDSNKTRVLKTRNQVSRFLASL